MERFMTRCLLIVFVYFSCINNAYPNSQDPVEDFQVFLDQSDLSFISESDAEEFNFLTVASNQFSFKTDLASVAKASKELRQALKTDVGRNKESDDDRSYILEFKHLRYDANLAKFIRLIVKKEFVPYTREITEQNPEIMEELLSLMEEYGVDDLSYIIASVCKADYLDPSSAKVTELLIHSNPKSHIINSLMNSICWHSLSKSQTNLKPDISAEDLFKNFITLNFDDLCKRFPFFQLGLKAFDSKTRTDTLIRRLLSRYRFVEWGETQDLNFTEEELCFFKFITGKHNNTSSSTYSGSVSFEGGKPRFGLTNEQKEAFFDPETNIDEGAAKELVFLDALTDQLERFDLGFAFRHSFRDNYGKNFYFLEIRKGAFEEQAD